MFGSLGFGGASRSLQVLHNVLVARSLKGVLLNDLLAFEGSLRDLF